MSNTLLETKREAVVHASTESAAARRALANHSDSKGQQRAAIGREQARLVQLESQDSRLYGERARTDAVLDDAKEDLATHLTIAVSGLLVRLHAADPVAHNATVQTIGAVIRSAVRSELDWPINQKFTGPHAVVAQALALVPMLPEMDRKVYELGSAVDGVSDWATRRDQLIPQLSSFLLDLTQLVAKVSPTPLETPAA